MKRKSYEVIDFFWSYVSWIAEESVKQGIKKIYFFTREGEFFKELYDQIKIDSPCRKELPAAEILEVSRISTFFPSLKEISLNEFMRIWTQYSAQSMQAFFKSLNVQTDPFQELLEKYQIVYDEVIEHPWKDHRVKKLFQDEQFRSRLCGERDRRKKILYRYFLQKGLVQGRKEKIGVVDIGWRGTIQDNLCYLFPEYEITGFYIGLQKFLTDQPVNSRKFGYINGCEGDQLILFTVTPLEMLCNSKNGSTLEYKMSDRKVCAVRKNDRQEDAVFYLYAEKEQKKIKSEWSTYCRMIQKGSAVPPDLKRKACRELYRFIAWPDRKSIAAYFLLKHNDEFGTGSYTDKRTRFEIRLFAGALFDIQKRSELKDFLRMTAWPQGYLARYWLYPVIWIYNRLLLRYLQNKNRENKN